MSSAAAFLQALREDPADETSLLIFADWAEEQGSPAEAARAELIRIQVELARWVPDLRRRTQLQEREQQLLREHTADWLGPLLPLCRSWRFERGLAHVTMTGEQFLAASFASRAEELLDRAWAHRLSLREAEASVAAAPQLRLLPALDLGHNQLDDQAASALARSPHLANLVHLDLSNNHITHAGYHSLLDSPSLRRLRKLDLRNNRIEERVVLAGSLPSRSLVIDLQGNDLAPRVWNALKESKPRHVPSPLSGNLPARLVNSQDMELVLIPAGTFLMGSPDSEHATERAANGPPGADERPRHEVTLTAPFYLGIYPVTQRQYEALVGNNPSDFTRIGGGGPDHPVENVTWDDARIFCERLSRLREERRAGRHYRLPTEAEWEHACRAGTTTAFSWGDTASSFEANFDGEKDPYGDAVRGPNLQRTTPVGSYLPNAFGVRDQHGNVWEWCNDWYDPGYYASSPASDPPGPSAGTRKALRGGSWWSAAGECRSGCRDYWYGTSYARNNVGFRVVMTVGKVEP